MSRGWFLESRRHSLSSRGIKTAQKVPKMHQLRSNGNNEQKRRLFVEQGDSSFKKLIPVFASSREEALFEASKSELFNPNESAKVFDDTPKNRSSDLLLTLLRKEAQF